MKCLHGFVAAGAIVAIGLCNVARAEHVLDQVPAHAVGVFEVKDLQAASAKVAKFAKTLGIDQFDPRFADPLAALQDQFELKQGIDKSGDMAIAFFAPKKEKGAAEGADDEPPVIVLIPTSDYKAFLGNFQDVKDEGKGLSEVTVPKNKEHLFVAHHGKYAAAAKDKALLSAEVGLKLQGPAAREAEKKDAILYIDMKELRPKLQEGLKQVQTEMEKQAKDPKAAKGNPFAAQMNPQMMKMIEQYIKGAEQIVRDSRSATISLNLSDTGISTSTVADFEPDSELGRLVAEVKNTDQPLSAGLPAATYFAFGGAKLTPEVTNKMFTDFIEPLIKDAAQPSPEITKALQSMKEVLGSMKSLAFGYVATAGAAGDGLVSVVGVAHGDANKIMEAQKEMLPAMNAFMGMSGQKTTVQIDFADPKTIDGVKIQPYTMKFNFDPNDAQAAQAQQMMSIMYGRNGLSAAMGAVDPQTFVSVQGASEKLLTDAIEAAKNNSDTLEKSAQVQKVSVELPKERVIEFYVALDNIASTAVKVLKQQGLAVPFKLPPNLPPIGISAGTEASTARIDVVIPTQLIQSITAAGMQAFMQMNGGPGNGQGGGI